MKHSSEIKGINRKKTSKIGISSPSKPRIKPIFVIVAGWILLGALGWSVLFLNGNVTMGGVPASIVLKFLQDPYSVAQFFLGRKTQLHNRLRSLGVEEEIKDYYRPQIPDETQLDQYIHQLLYERTGYVGRDYFVSPDRILVLKPSRKIR